ncbi:hypothetical protein VHEMI08891 [[Torrubiella] hemipterigena]|uniref:ATP-grasp domain-containing protein n=1 Tax=[Torrubiella] hemipterigena TaxID=1531966 RepID=A0A0A1TQJ2_9HYPO|nr:hypothetical protein VHEMI08891 [[Torrubiella] hemipterigena]
MTLSKKLVVAVVYENQDDYLQQGYTKAQVMDLAHPCEVDPVVDALVKLGHTVERVPGIQHLVRALAKHEGRKWDLVFNMSEGFFGSSREAQVPGLLEAYQILFTFGSAATMATCLNKVDTKIILQHHNIPTAPFVRIQGHESTDSLDLNHIRSQLPTYPVFVKPSMEGTCMGIDSASRASNEDELRRKIETLQTQHPGQDILVESFLAGRDITVSLVGTGANTRVLGALEWLWEKKGDGFEFHTGYTKGCFILSEFEKQPDNLQGSAVYRVISEEGMKDPQVQAACKTAVATWKLFNCRDAGRVDLRFDKNGPDGVPNVLEVNPIAGLEKDESLLPMTAKLGGLEFTGLIDEIVRSALLRRKA